MRDEGLQYSSCHLNILSKSVFFCPRRTYFSLQIGLHSLFLVLFPQCFSVIYRRNLNFGLISISRVHLRSGIHSRKLDNHLLLAANVFYGTET